MDHLDLYPARDAAERAAERIWGRLWSWVVRVYPYADGYVLIDATI